MRSLVRVVSAVSVALALTVGSLTVVSAALRVPIEWTACSDDDTAECAWLEVLIDRSDPLSGSFQLPVRRVRASDDERRLGTLVTIAGGPGQRGTDWVVPGLHTPTIHQHFDVVSWDPRGTSAGSLIDCIPDWDPYEGLDRSPDDVAEQRALDRQTAHLAAACRDAHGAFLPFVGTHAAALDLERLRQALQEEQISILGSSYGSEVALTYATLFPERVRAVVLDGYSDPNQPPDERLLEQAQAFERALDALLAQCAADPDCSLGVDDAPGATLDRLLRDLDASPLAGDDPERPLSQSDAHEAIVGSLVRGDAERRALIDALAAAAGGDGDPLRGIADAIRRAYEANGLTMGAFTAVECADDGPYWERLPSREVAALAGRVRETATRLGAWLWSPPLDPDLPPVGLCAMQPFYITQDIGSIDAAGAGPVLVLTTTGDPTTPAVAAERSTDDLAEAFLLVLEADHHLAYHVALGDRSTTGHACVLEAVERYLIHQQMPPAGQACG